MPVEIRVPVLGESVVEATVARWLKQPGETVSAGEPLVELETDKVNVEVPAETGGVLGAIAKIEGAVVNVGEVLGTVAESNGAAVSSVAPPAASNDPMVAPAATANGRESSAGATPVAAKIAADNNIDLNTVKGTGPGGKIVKEDVANKVEQKASAPETATVKAQETAAVVQAPAMPPPTPPAPLPRREGGDEQGGRPETREKMTRRRQTIATRLVEAQRMAAMLTTFNEVDMSAVMEVRKRRKDSFKERHGVNLGFMSFFTKAVIGALRAFPYLNAEIQGDEIVKKGYYDIGIAVGAEEGLVVPVVRDADKKSFAQIEKSIGELATKAKENKLSLAELTGGTFTITNGGVFGSLMSTPILNAPQVGILGMHTIKNRPVEDAQNPGQIVLRPMMYLALSYDHRLVDGSEAVRFLVKIKDLIEDPETLLLEG